MGFHFVVSIYFRTTSLYLTISQQITQHQLFQIPQRYRFSSKSQHSCVHPNSLLCCFRYHKGTDFQANHNTICYVQWSLLVVLDTTKVQIFKQITTRVDKVANAFKLFQIPQRYRFSSKSQLADLGMNAANCCFRYHKGTDFQANHNHIMILLVLYLLFQIPQRYRFSSKSQPWMRGYSEQNSCFRYHKGTDFQANHNLLINQSNSIKLFQIPQRYRFSSKSQLIGLVRC